MKDDAPVVARITSQVEALSNDPANRTQLGYKVGFITAAGATGTVWVAKDGYDPAKVLALVKEQAMKLDQVQGQEVR